MSKYSFSNRLRQLILSATGHYIPDMHEVEQAEHIYYIKNLRLGQVVFDVGANIGEISLLFSRFVGSKGKVHSFEASSETFNRLKNIIDLAHRTNIQLNHLALSDRVDKGYLNVYDTGHDGWTTLANRPLQDYGIDIKPVRVEEVTMITIDDYCENQGIERIDLLKIDVEGAEYQVITGAERMFSERRIGCCVFEFGQTTFDMGNDPGEIARFIKDRGYKLSNLNRGAPLFPGGHSASTAQFSMCLCTPR